jgi:hypothetical protein
MGLRSELKGHAYRSRFGQHRVDVQRQRKELMLVLGVGAGVLLTRALSHRAQPIKQKAA